MVFLAVSCVLEAYEPERPCCQAGSVHAKTSIFPDKQVGQAGVAHSGPVFLKTNWPAGKKKSSLGAFARSEDAHHTHTHPRKQET